VTVKRCVVKIGSGVLSAGATQARLDPKIMRRLAREMAAAHAAGQQIVLVSSGAILAGIEGLGLKERPQSVELKQAAAAVGQSRLMRSWQESFGRKAITVAQILLTRDDVRHRGRYLNARNTLFALLERGIVPVINENDTVAPDEILFGGNDVLSALVAGLVDADLLVLLTDQDGLYSADPRQNPEAKFIASVGAEDKVLGAGKAGPRGKGGMESKVRAARMAAASGQSVVIANGLKPGVLAKVLSGRGAGTYFAPRTSPLDRRGRWLAHASHAKGQIHVDAGAREALVRQSRSLLPSGVRAVAGDFSRGDVVGVICDGVEFARGLSNYDSVELARIKGLKTSQIEAVLGHKTADEVVHHDNLAVLEL